MARRFSLLCACLPLFAAVTLGAGCGKKEADTEVDLPRKRTVTSATTTPVAVSRGDPLKAALDGVIRGRVVLQGERPALAIIKPMLTHNDHVGCLEGSEVEKVDQTWILGPDNGVANVVIFLKAPAGKYFPVKDSDKVRKDTVMIDQPHCAFMPHVAAAFPSYWDGKELQPTGEQFVVKNSAPFNHNTGWTGSKTGTGNVNLKSNSEQTINLVPDSSPVLLRCDIHPWMNARVWAFDHPYFAVTKSDGNFEIKDVPTGVEVGLVAWHEALSFFNGGKDGTKQKFNPGENKLPDFKISAK
ncbi:MAG TPA: hypothetical protein VNX28_03790 [Gemmataceae bacterium]|nr:hypothetical protein [Gemmataceae bacterium]